MGGAGELAGHAFISYVREDSAQVDGLQRALEAAGVRVWRDTSDLWPGEDWPAKIRDAITSRAFVFIACFSRRSMAREKSYQNEELALAVDQLRLRRPDVPWLIPVRFDDCAIPDLAIGGGRTLASLQRADLFGEHRDEAVSRLVAAVLRILAQQRGGPTADRPGERRSAHGLDRASVSPTEAVSGQAGSGRAPVISGATDDQAASPQAQTARRPWWRVALTNPWTVAVGAPLIVVALIAIGTHLTALISGNGSALTGSVWCESGRPVVGVWIAASSGQSDSGHAHLGSATNSGLNTYTYLLPHGGTYSVHVGCGGTASRWASRNFSPVLSGPTAHLECDDPAGPPVNGVGPEGKCAAASAAPAATSVGTRVKGTITSPLNGATNVKHNRTLHASGTINNLQPGHQLLLFLNFANEDKYYGGDPNPAIITANGRWSGRIFVGGDKKPGQRFKLYLVDLGPQDRGLVNNQGNPDWGSGWPSSMVWGPGAQVLYSLTFTTD